MPQLNLGILSSHRGTNLQAIIDACRQGHIEANCCVVISNNSKSGALERATKSGIPSYHLSGDTHRPPSNLDETIRDVLEKHNVNLVVLAGYMKLLGPLTISHFRNRILNIHPGLLPRFGGKGMYGDNVHRAVLESGQQITGVTIHLVAEEYDLGSIIAQTKIAISPGECIESLKARVLELEHELYVDTLSKIATGYIQLPT